VLRGIQHKLEGAIIITEQSSVGIRDPILIGQRDSAFSTRCADARVRDLPDIALIGAKHQLSLLHGKNGVMGDFEPLKTWCRTKWGLVGEVTPLPPRDLQQHAYFRTAQPVLTRATAGTLRFR
jgi:hypothetical protein